MEEYDELIPHPDKAGCLDLTHRSWVELDSVLWTFSKELLVLNIAFNNIERLPPELGHLTLLRDLNCSCNKLSSLPAEIGKCTRLRTLKANGNRLTEIPQTLAQCVLLDTLVLSENKLRGVPAALGSLQGLRVVRLGNNDLNYLPHQIGTMPSLEELDCQGNARLDMVPAPFRGERAGACAHRGDLAQCAARDMDAEHETLDK
ncbi:hypothetical protein JKP88DRAFT_157061 [Tribonema minus]|uniref:Uncharacterized protein n=1 Tax=Tribonema minus TaxID=303371 RepID=A0A836CI12_9STRA|nr:hypothetical protein JKP88DRAFT_157061 [Tribonema minus]